MIKFDNYKGPSVYGNANPGVFPVFPQTNSSAENSDLKRTQFPLNVRYASTVNKVQGKSLDQIVISLSDPEMGGLGHTYTALSRARAIEGILIEHFHESRFLNIKTVKEWTDALRSKRKRIEELIEEKQRLFNLFLKTKAKFSLNRGKKRGLDEISQDVVLIEDEIKAEE